MTPTERRRALVAVITSISVVGLALGLSIPLASLILERRGVDSGLIGLTAAMPALGILFFSPFIPGLVRRLGTHTMLYLSILLAAGAVLALPFFTSIPVWLLLRFLMGVATGPLFVLSETWINQIALEHNRGRLVALYVTVFSLCLATGPLLIGVTGTDGALPFIIACLILLVAAAPLPFAGNSLPVAKEAASFSVLAFIRLAPSVCLAVLLFAFLDACSLSLLAIFGLRHGYSEATAALMVTALVVGNMALQLPIGWLADRMNRDRLLGACGLGLLLSTALLPWAVDWPLLLWPVLVLMGAFGGGLYTLAMIILGQRYTGADLVTANAALGVLWGIGNLAGPLLAGIGMRILDPNGLPLTLVLATLAFLWVLGRQRRMAAVS